VELLRVLSFHKGKTPLRNFVQKLYALRLEAKSQKKGAAQIIYKLILVSLYGRLGFKPDFPVTKIVTLEELKFYIDSFMFEDWVELSSDLYLLTYKQSLVGTSTEIIKRERQSKLKQELNSRLRRILYSNTAVHLAAAITSYARIHMYQYIQDESVVYTDTDSIITTKPLPEEDISSNELGKMKLETKHVDYVAARGKFFVLRDPEGKEKVVKSGIGKEHVTFETASKFLKNNKSNKTVKQNN